ncbi:MAG: hypothetical protein AB1631_25210 [Acidobacteriota bacterium]
MKNAGSGQQQAGLSRSEKLAAAAIFVAVVACILTAVLWWRVQQNTRGNRSESPSGDNAAAPTPGQTGDGWLKGTAEDKFSQVEKQLRGLDKTMVEVGYRFTELYFAGREHNWDYARYQAEKMDLAIRLGLERRPKRAQSAQFFLTDEMPAVLKAIESKDDEIFLQSMHRLRSSCMKCHNLEKVPFFTVEFPEHHVSPVRNIP